MMDEGYRNQENCNYLRVQANINLQAIKQNLEQIRANISENTAIMAIIKADGYGHGAIPIARMLEEDKNVAAYGVAIIEEAVALRKAGMKKPILILGYTDKEQYEQVVSYDITQTVFQYEMASHLSNEAKRQGKIVKIHIKLDTGMSRIGFSDSEESITEIKRIKELPFLQIEGMYTHFAAADECDKSSANIQINRYIAFAERLEKENIVIPIKHMANSAGILDLPRAYFNMVRSGIATYGIYPSEQVNKENIKLIPAMELKTHVVFVKDVKPGVGISYGATYLTKKESRIATIPIGYADGYSRNLSNCFKVLIHGKFAPIIGRICMDQFMVDVTEIEEVKQGDVVTLLGQDGAQCITVEELSEASHSFPYELVCTVTKRVPRVYFGGRDA